MHRTCIACGCVDGVGVDVWVCMGGGMHVDVWMVWVWMCGYAWVGMHVYVWMVWVWMCGYAWVGMHGWGYAWVGMHVDVWMVWVCMGGGMHGWVCMCMCGWCGHAWVGGTLVPPLQMIQAARQHQNSQDGLGPRLPP